MNKAIFDSAANLRHELHKHPCLSGDERATVDTLIRYLKANSTLEINDMGNYFYAAYRTISPTRRIAFRSDMDALPISEDNTLPYHSQNEGISHKCGHDGHCAALAAFAVGISKIGSKNDIFFLFQHSEENGSGAKECCDFIKKEHIDEIYGFHNMPGFPLGSVMVHTGVAACSSVGLIMNFIGKSSHASQPEKGINPAFAISELVLKIPELTQKTDYRGMVMCTVIGIRVGSSAFGTGAGDGRLMLTVRAEYEAELKLLLDKLLFHAKNLCQANMLEFGYECVDAFPETVNDRECSQKIKDCCKSLNIPIERWDEPFRSSEDFGYYCKETKGALFYIGDGISHPALHTLEFDFPDEIIETAFSIYSELAK